jgi:hypothetical protein
MDIFSLLMGAKVVDLDGAEYNEVVEFYYTNGRLTLVLGVDYEEDDDDPDKEKISPPTINENIMALSRSKKVK